MEDSKERLMPTLLAVAGVALSALGASAPGHGSSSPPAATTGSFPPPPSAVVQGSAALDDPTWAGEVAAVVRANCVGCHHPSGSAPFSLATYEEARERAERMARAVRGRHMPPWLPDSDGETFVAARILDDDQIETLVSWAEAGAPPGDLSTVPPPPDPEDDWPLGEPDLVVELPEFTVPAEGTDIYRNLVVPVPVEEERWVRAVDFQPGDPRVVHHARMMVDYTSSSMLADLESPGPGFDGMDVQTDASNPAGHFVGWTPGKFLLEPPEGMAWRVDPDTDLVPQLHLRTTGLEETVRGRIGLYFAEGPPTLHPAVLIISSFMIDIPPGESDYQVSNSFTLPVPVEVLSVYPHAHYLGKEMTVTAIRPNGRETELLHIPDWDFDWQDEYRFREPVRLPAGTVLVMEYSYDNSSDNPDNPYDPPRRVVYGSNSTDEMADLILQVLPRSEAERDELLQAQAWAHDSEDMAYMSQMERTRGEAALTEGRTEDAIGHFQESLQYRSDDPRVLAGLARAFVENGDVSSAGFIAERAMQLSGGRGARVLDARAAVHAALGEMEAAVDLAREAAERAEEQGEPELAREIRERLQRYREGGGG